MLGEDQARKQTTVTLVCFALTLLTLVGVGAWLSADIRGQDMLVTQEYTPAGRIKAIRAAIRVTADSLDVRTKKGCPRVDYLERTLPQLRGIHRAERDYAGLLEGLDC